MSSTTGCTVSFHSIPAALHDLLVLDQIHTALQSTDDVLPQCASPSNLSKHSTAQHLRTKIAMPRVRRQPEHVCEIVDRSFERRLHTEETHQSVVFADPGTTSRSFFSTRGAPHFTHHRSFVRPCVLSCTTMQCRHKYEAEYLTNIGQRHRTWLPRLSHDVPRDIQHDPHQSPFFSQLQTQIASVPMQTLLAPLHGLRDVPVSRSKVPHERFNFPILQPTVIDVRFLSLISQKKKNLASRMKLVRYIFCLTTVKDDTKPA